MSVSYSQMLQSFREEKGAFLAAISADWMQGRTTYGGLAAALSLEGTLRAHPSLPPLRSAQVSFIGPAGGEVRVAPQLLRQGKSVAFVGADLASVAVPYHLGERFEDIGEYYRARTEPLRDRID